MNFVRGVGYCGIIIVLILTGCGQAYHSKNQGHEQDSRLAVTVHQPHRLREINSIAVALPRIKEGVKTSVISPTEARNTIINTMREMLSIKIIEHAATSDVDAKGKASMASDCILSTDLIRIERRTSQLGGDPALVSFRMSVSLAKTDELVWSGQFYYRQPTVTDNVLSLGTRGGGTGSSVMRFAGAQEVFREGVRLAIADFNARREEQFFK